VKQEEQSWECRVAVTVIPWHVQGCRQRWESVPLVQRGINASLSHPSCRDGPAWS